MAQVALSLILLLAAGLFMRSLQRASRIDIGFNPDDVRIVSFDLSKDGYDEADGSAFLLNLQQRVSELPGVTAAGFAHELPLDLGRSETPVFPEGYRSEDDRPWIQSDFAVVSEGYFEAAGIVVRRGRAFDSSDRSGALPVAVVSRTMAERVWPGEDAIGKRLSDTQDGELFTVIGIVDDIKNSTLMDEPTPMLYRPLAQNYRPGLTLLARHTEAGGEGLAERIRETVLDADPRLALSPVQTLEAYTSIGVLPQKLAAGITGGLGGLALLLCALGIYGVVAYAVAQRTREIGVRIAVGARRTDVVRMVLRDGLKLALPGLVVGLGLGIALSFLIRGFILGVGPADPLTFSAAALVLLLAVLVASVLPARRAARIEPTIALRSE